MRSQCQICGEYESQNTTVLQGHDVCLDCVDMLVENEVERKGERQASAESGRDYKADFRDRQLEAQKLK